MTGRVRLFATRRDYLRVIGATVAGAAAVGASGTQASHAASGEEWPQYGYDFANKSYAPDNTGPVASIEKRWRYYERKGSGSAPTVGGEQVFVGVGDDMYVLSTSNGESDWRYRSIGDVTSTPAVVDGRVFVGAEDKIRAFSTESQSEEWFFETDGQVETSPLVADGTVYIGSKDGVLYALDGETGKLEWEFDTGFQESVTTTPVFSFGNIFFGATDTRLIAVDAKTGLLQMEMDVENPISGAPAATSEYIYSLIESGVLHVTETKAPHRSWSIELGEPVESSPAITDQKIYIGDMDGRLHALDINSIRQTRSYNPSLRWTFDADAALYSPVVAGETVYVGSEDGTVYALDAQNGTLHWSYDTGGAVRDQPAVVDGQVYVRSNKRGVFALDLSVSADIDFSPRTPDTRETVTFDGSGSEPSEIISSYEWTIDGTTLSGKTVEYTFEQKDTYTVTLTVSDGNGHTDTVSELVGVDTKPPEASFTYTPESPVSGETLTFDATSSSDPDGSITEYKWLINGVRSLNGQTVQHTFDSPGEYYVDLRVTDNAGETDSVRQTITVTDPSATTTTPEPTTTTPEPTTPGTTTTTPEPTTPGTTTTTTVPTDPGTTTTTPEPTNGGPGSLGGGEGGGPPDPGSEQSAQPWAHLGIGAVAGLTGLASWLHFDIAKRMNAESGGATAATTDGGQTPSEEETSDDVVGDSDGTTEPTSPDEPSDQTDEHTS